MKGIKNLLIFLFLGGFTLHASDPDGLKLDPEVWEETIKGITYDQLDDTTESVKDIPTEPVGWNFEFMSPVLYGIVILLALIALILIIKNFKQPISVKANRMEATSIEDAEDNLPDVTLIKIHQEALDKGDFKSALRIKFLMLLQTMIDSGLILWKKKKTNEQYLKDLGSSSGVQRHSFQHIVTLYDRVWYGKDAISETQYRLVSEHIIFLDNQLHEEQ